MSPVYCVCVGEEVSLSELTLSPLSDSKCRLEQWVEYAYVCDKCTRQPVLPVDGRSTVAGEVVRLT